MREKIAELIRLHNSGRSQVEIAAGTGIARSTVQDYLRRVSANGVTLEEAKSLSTAELLERLGKKGKGHRGAVTHTIDFAWVCTELKRKGVTRALLFQELFRDGKFQGSYQVFCRLLKKYLKDTNVVLRTEYRGGEYCFVDYAGLTVSVWDRRTSEILFEAQIFVACLGASNYTFCEATKSQELLHFIGSHVRAIAFFGGVAHAHFPDNLKSGIKKINWFEPETTKAYGEFANHYGTTILPARVRKPRDKAKVEKAVQQVEREILAPVRHQKFYSLSELNDTITVLLKTHNERRMKTYGASRRELFEAIDKPALLPLPAQTFNPAEWKMARVNLDYHIEFQRHYYSVPYVHVKEDVWVRASENLIEVFLENALIAMHIRSSQPFRHTTTEAHMPPKHREVRSWKGENFLVWAQSVGPHTHHVVETMLSGCRFEPQAFRAILGLQRLAKAYSNQRLEAASHKALHFGAVSCKSIRTFLQKEDDNLDKKNEPLTHDNLRDPTQYH